MNLSFVVLVNEQDEQTGIMEKMEAHEKALLHRAFSVFIFNRNGEMLLQQRALSKYHSGGLWTNACCSHPNPGETTTAAASRRLREEMGFETTLEKIFDFVYKADFDNGLTEHEFDHVFAGVYEGPIAAAPEEVSDYCYQPVQEIKKAMETDPARFTAWFRIAFPRIEKWWTDHYQSVIHKDN
jgi:isopentenyl-diphosphate Delta-isomerase